MIARDPFWDYPSITEEPVRNLGVWPLNTVNMYNRPEGRSLVHYHETKSSLCILSCILWPFLEYEFLFLPVEDLKRYVKIILCDYLGLPQSLSRIAMHGRNIWNSPSAAPTAVRCSSTMNTLTWRVHKLALKRTQGEDSGGKRGSGKWYKRYGWTRHQKVIHAVLDWDVAGRSLDGCKSWSSRSHGPRCEAVQWHQLRKAESNKIKFIV